MSRNSKIYIGNYETIRELLRSIFVFGCFNVDDFGYRGIKKDKYNKDIQKIKSMINKDILNVQRIKGKYAYYFQVNMYDTSYNVLYDSFMSKSFTENEIVFSLKLLQIFSKNNQSFTQNEILRELECYNQEDERKNEKTEEITVYRRLQYLEENGYIEKSYVQGCEYRLTKDIFGQLNEKEFNQLICGVDFMRNFVYPSVCGHFLFDTLNSYYQKKWKKNSIQSIFMFKHNHFAHILDDEILWLLLISINNKREIGFIYNQREYNHVRPLVIFADEQYGRRYLMAGINALTSQTKIFCLDKISGVKYLETDNQWDEAKLSQLVKEQENSSLTGGCDSLGRKPVIVGLQVKNSMVKRIKDEVRDLIVGVQSIDEKNTRFELKVNDPIEIKPWLRRYTGKIIIEESREHHLKEIMAKELEVWRKRYGIV